MKCDIISELDKLNLGWSMMERCRQTNPVLMEKNACSHLDLQQATFTITPKWNAVSYRKCCLFVHFKTIFHNLQCFSLKFDDILTITY